MPVHDAQRVGADVAVDRHTEHLLVVLKVVRLVGAEVRRIDQRRDAILDDTAPGNLLQPNVVGDAGLQEQAETRIDSRENICFEGGEIIERRDLGVGLLP